MSINAFRHDPKIDNTTKVFFDDFILRSAVPLGQIVFRQFPLCATATYASPPGNLKIF